ncbi:HNH endonuclease [Lactococcus lactis subsp. lactis]|uniref:HNH endonuclease n=1 Tax=Lactococcus lactis TaxID=1358 RepID=UPI00300DC25F
MPMTGRCREPNCHAVVIRPLHYCTKHADKEAAYQESRERWTNRTDNTKRYKDYNKRKREYSDIKVEQNKFYQSKQWKSIRDVVRRRDNFLCQYCKAHNRVRTGKIVDHIVPVEFDLNGKTIMDNLAFCCSKCHTRKTKWEQIYYGTGYGNKTKNVIPIKNVKDVPDFQKNER